MYVKNLKVIKGIVILIPVLLALPMIVTANTGKRYPDPRKFENHVAMFETKDKYFPPPQGEILVVGSSSIAFWHDDLYWDMEPLKVIPRGVGGTNMNYLLYYAERLIIKYKPRAVLVYEGDNDIGYGIGIDTYIDTFNAFVQKMHDTLPQTRIYFISIKPSITRWDLWPTMQTANARVQTICNADPLLTYIDVATHMINTDGTLKKELFRDGLHMNRKGYLIWADIIKPILMANEAAPLQQSVSYRNENAPQGIPVNIAFKKPVTVSSEYSTIFPAKTITDGDLTTFWGSKIIRSWPWVTIDLGSTMTMNTLAITWNGIYYPTSYDLYTSEDGVTWRYLRKITKNTVAADSFDVTLSFRHIGLLITKKNSIICSIKEVEIYSTSMDIVHFSDKNLENIIRKTLNKPVTTIRKSDLLTLTQLDAGQKQITSLDGIEHCINLEMLALNQNYITDITPLQALTKLQYLNIAQNNIKDITPLAPLNALTTLNASSNAIIDLNPLRDLFLLQSLYLSDNSITNLAPISGLFMLEVVSVSNNALTTIDSINSLPNLRELYAAKNMLTTIHIGSLTTLQTLVLEDNAIGDISSLQSLTALKKLYLNNNRIQDLTPINLFTGLEWCFINDNNMMIKASDPQGAVNIKVISSLLTTAVKIYFEKGNIFK